MKLLFIDLEYANFKNKSICELSIIALDSEDEKPISMNYIINPHDTFDDGCIKMHGITPEIVNTKPSFKDVWRDIESLFINSIVVGHNVATSDLEGLYKNLINNEIQVPEIYYICTYELSKLLIPKYCVRDYSLNSLYFYYNLNIENQNNSIEKLYTYYKFAIEILSNFKHNIEEHINRFEPIKISSGIDYHTNVSLKKDIHTLYGTIEGFLLDEEIDDEEINYLVKWKKKYKTFDSYKDISEIIKCIDEILIDEKVTIYEVKKLKDIVKRYLDVISTSAITLATQILNGIISGISLNQRINIDECICLQKWLYENSFLIGHYPFDKIFNSIEQILQDGVITMQEEKIILSETNKLLHPIEKLKKDLYTLEGKTIYLSGDFVFGTIQEVEEVLKQQGYLITNNKESADVILYGGYTEVLSSDGVYLREGEDNWGYDTPLNKILFNYIKKRGMTTTQAYKAANMSKQMMYKLRWNENYHPSKKNLCAFAIALKLDLNETLSLLSSIGYTLSEDQDFDKVIIKSIKNKNYNIEKIEEELLYKYDIDWTSRR